MLEIAKQMPVSSSASKTRFWEEYRRVNQLLQLGIELTISGPGDLFQV